MSSVRTRYLLPLLFCLMESFHDLSKIKISARNQEWEQKFLDAFVASEVLVTSEDVQVGPDGWPYLYLNTDLESGSGMRDKALNVVQWAYQHGVGLVINPQKEKPDYVFNFGMLWSYAHRSVFVSLFDDVYDENAQVYIAKVTDDIIPNHAQNILKEYIRSAGVENPRAALITRNKVNYELAFGIESLNNPPNHEHQGIAKGLSWFMPTDMPIVLLYEKKFQELYPF
ncbi:MAG: hypothetical protein M9899_01930 [Bdellovibrionaceae bacterium]|nr:hypothetical protein [Pseudobdellovibrionaceae bacterium]